MVSKADKKAYKAAQRAYKAAQKVYEGAMIEVLAAGEGGDREKKDRATVAYNEALIQQHRARLDLRRASPPKPTMKTTDRLSPNERKIGMKDLSPSMRAYVVRQVTRGKAKAARNVTIVKEIKAGTRTVKELAARYKVCEATIRGIFADATGRPAPYEPSAAQLLCSPQRLSLAYRRERALAIVAARKKGVTLRKLADRYGVTRERIRSIYVDATRDDYEARCRQRRLRQR